MNIARQAKDCGIELFVLDDGWFGHRDSDDSSLGDWYVDTRKLPNGMRHLTDQVHAMGLKFGLWFEPEMISPDSDLYRAHPDWALTDGFEPLTGRNELLLDLTKVHELHYHWVKGHADNPKNNRCDQLAVSEWKKFK